MEEIEYGEVDFPDEVFEDKNIKVSINLKITLELYKKFGSVQAIVKFLEQK